LGLEAVPALTFTTGSSSGGHRHALGIRMDSEFNGMAMRLSAVVWTTRGQ
jgi:hypothetical protein